MYEKCEVKVLVVQLCPTLCNPMAHQGSLSKGFSRQKYWNGWSFPSPGDLPDAGIEPRSPALQADSLLSEPAGKPKNTGVLSLLQGIFPTQELSQGLLHCRRIPSQATRGAPCFIINCKKHTLHIHTHMCPDIRSYCPLQEGSNH